MKRVQMSAAMAVITVILVTSGAWAQGIAPSTTLERRMAALETTVRTLQSQIAGLQDANTVLQGKVTQQHNEIATLKSQVGTLQFLTRDHNNILKYFSVNHGDMNGLKGPHVIVTGVNVHIRSGSGNTHDNNSLLGLGNLVVGYNEGGGASAMRSGSHNIVVGPNHGYSSWGGFVIGFGNNILKRGATVTGGYLNVADADFSSISGGSRNKTSGDWSSISGGYNNATSATFTSVSGGADNKAQGAYSAVSGGAGKTASGQNAWVGGNYHTP